MTKRSDFLSDAIDTAMAYPGISVGIVARNYKELEQDFLDRVLSHDDQLDAEYHPVKKRLTFSNGSIIRFLYAESLQDVWNVSGTNFQAFYIDGRVSSEIIENYCVRLRTLRDGPPVLGVFVSE